MTGDLDVGTSEPERDAGATGIVSRALAVEVVVGLTTALPEAGPKHDARPPGDLFSMIAYFPRSRGQLIPRHTFPPNTICSISTTRVITATITTSPTTAWRILARAVAIFLSSPPDATHSNPPKSRSPSATRPAMKNMILMRLPMRSCTVGTQNHTSMYDSVSGSHGAPSLYLPAVSQSAPPSSTLCHTPRVRLIDAPSEAIHLHVA